MYLMDALVDCAASVKGRNKGMRVSIAGLNLNSQDRLLSIYQQMTDQLEGCPRFLFDDDAIHTAVELTIGRPKVLLEAMLNIRLPYPKLWVEWAETGRQKLRDAFPDVSPEQPDRPLPQRVGFLLECDTTGRKGQATWAWTMKDGPPNIGPFAPFFDLDRRFRQTEEDVFGLIGANVARLWHDNPVQLKALLEIWRTAQHRTQGPWGDLYLETVGSIRGPDAVRYAMADVYGEYIQMWACLLLLTSSRKIVDLKPVDQSRLNRARAKRREPPRLDHTVVSIHLDLTLRQQQIRAPLGHARKSPRVHLVQSYLNRRGDKHWITQPFFRGTGEMIHRRIRVKQ